MLHRHMFVVHHPLIHALSGTQLVHLHPHRDVFVTIPTEKKLVRVVVFMQIIDAVGEPDD